MKTFKLIVLIGLIFCAGFLAGIVTTRIAVRHFIQRAIAQPELVRERIERGLDRRYRAAILPEAAHERAGPARDLRAAAVFHQQATGGATKGSLRNVAVEVTI